MTAPIAARLGINNLLATEPEEVNGQFTGKVAGTPCFQNGKVERLQEWLRESNEDLNGSWFYTDSHNDLPLLGIVDNPVAVSPDDELRRTAIANDWSILETL